LEEKIVIGKERIQAYTNDNTVEGHMDIVLELDNGKKFIINNIPCHPGKGQFKWVPEEIPDGTHGVFSYTFTSEDGSITYKGTSSSMKFGKLI